jgi:Helicase conserved C-terminal domain/SNF2-related domain
MTISLDVGDLVRLRGREWVVEAVKPGGTSEELSTVELACIADDAQGESLRAVLESEIDVRLVQDDLWQQIGREGSDDPKVLAAHVRAVAWKSATAADRDLFQAPFRAGIRLDPYQLLPLSKALKLPRVNLLIADDVGLGKTVEAGLVLREMLLRRRVDFVVVSAPAAMITQWQDELAQKFGLGFTIVDRDYLAAVRRAHGFAANPWAVGSRFLVSHSLLADETYASGLKDALGPFRPRALLILDEAHHAAPASGQAYAVDSQFTKAVRALAEKFEHRLFLSATPHNGHSNSFAALLEILDPQRFTRGFSVEPDDLEPVMVRRLKNDLRKLGVARFPRRIIEPAVIKDLPANAPELVLATLLQSYRDWCESGLQGTALARTRFLLSGLQQRLLSSIPAFARTLRRHLSTLQRHRDKAGTTAGSEAAAALLAQGPPDVELSDTEEDHDALLETIQAEEDDIVESATSAAAAGLRNFDEAMARVEAMLEIAKQSERRPDARVAWLVDWIWRNMLDGARSWNVRRLIVFTEWEDTRLWLERRLKEEFGDTERGDERIATFTGLTGQRRRDEVKLAFNADPAKEPLRILLCTDAAREGINLQTRCCDLVHFDLPWNPSRLEQRNGRIDRKLQPASDVYCRYFVYAQRPEDQVLAALVRKTETIRDQLGSAGQVIADRIHQRLTRDGIARPAAAALARDIEAEQEDARTRLARREMADEEERRLARLKRELDQLDRELQQARLRVGIAPDELQGVVEIALQRDGVPLVRAENLPVQGAWRLDPDAPHFARDASWADVFDELREGRPPRKRLGEWRAEHPVRAISFQPLVLEDDRDAEGVVQVHLEHRLVRRLLSRFVSHGFQSGLNRATAISAPGGRARVVLVGRLALYGPGAARLHEQIIPVTAMWSEGARQRGGLSALGEAGEETTLAALEQALRDATMPTRDIVDRLLRGARNDIADLRPVLEQRAQAAAEKAKADLAKIAARESRALKTLLEAQRDRIVKESAAREALQLELDLSDPVERRQREADRRSWQRRLAALDKEIVDEPARVAASYDIRAERLEPVGLIYLWPQKP